MKATLGSKFRLFMVVCASCAATLTVGCSSTDDASEPSPELAVSEAARPENSGASEAASEDADEDADEAAAPESGVASTETEGNVSPAKEEIVAAVDSAASPESKQEAQSEATVPATATSSEVVETRTPTSEQAIAAPQTTSNNAAELEAMIAGNQAQPPAASPAVDTATPTVSVESSPAVQASAQDAAVESPSEQVAKENTQPTNVKEVMTAPVASSPVASSPVAVEVPAAIGGLVPEDGALMPYYIERGDTLSSIAQKILGSSKKWRDLATLNKVHNPSQIYAGDIVYFKVSEISRSFAVKYTGFPQKAIAVQAGETLCSLAKKLLGTESEWRTLWKMNAHIKNPDVLKIGAKISYYEIPAVALNRE